MFELLICMSKIKRESINHQVRRKCGQVLRYHFEKIFPEETYCLCLLKPESLTSVLTDSFVDFDTKLQTKVVCI